LLSAILLGIVSVSAQKASLNENSFHDIAWVNLLNLKATQHLQLYPDSTFIYADSAYRSAVHLKYKEGQTNALNNLGAYNQTKGKFTPAMSSYLKVIEMTEDVDTKQRGTAFLGLAQIYKDMSADHTPDYTDKGIEYSRMAANVFRNLKDTTGLANSLSTTGILFRDKAKQRDITYYDSAFFQYKKAIELERAAGRPSTILPKLYNNISQVYLEYKEDYKKALEYLFKAVEGNKLNNYITGLTHNYGNISNAYLKLKDYDKAIEYARLMVAASQQLNRPMRVYFSYKSLSTAYEIAGRYDSSLAYFKRASDLNDSIANIKRTEQVLDLELKYETAKKELQIKNLNLESEAKSNRIIALIALSVIMVAVATGFIVLYKRVQHQKERLDVQSKQLAAAMSELQVQKTELEEVGKVKDKLFSVISHDLRTPVNTLVSFATLLEKDNIPAEKLKSYSNILKKTLSQTSTLMNNLLQWAATQMHGFKPVIDKVEVAAVAVKVMNELAASAIQKQVTVKNNISDHTYVYADADMLAVILRNLIANAIKYVQPVNGEITLELKRDDELMQIRVVDNGIGMQQDAMDQFNNVDIAKSVKSTAGTEKEQGTGLGLMLCKTLVKLMNGKMSAASPNGIGTAFSVYMPAA
jgi:signal transduction histidine kinase